MATLKDILHAPFVGTFLKPLLHHDQALSDASSLFISVGRALHTYGIDYKEDVFGYWIPARIEILGKHTDYAGGKSVLAALSKGFAFVVHPNDSHQLVVIDARSRQKVKVDLKSGHCSATYPWALYVKTLVERVWANFGVPVGGATICMASNIPPAAGMSSSSALITGLFMALTQVYGLEQGSVYNEHIKTVFDLADYLGHIENGQTYRGLEGEKGVGTLGGSQDHTAILCAKAGSLRLFSFLPTTFLDEVALPEGYCFVIASSGVRAEKTRRAKDSYNHCVLSVKRILEHESIHPVKNYSTLRELVTHPDFDLEEARNRLKGLAGGEVLFDRMYQFIQESEVIIPSFFASLKSNDLDGLGALTDRSQQLAASHLMNQIDETNDLVRIARSLGAVASSAFGAGFGGSVWALVASESAEDFSVAWSKAYLGTYPQWQKGAQFFIDYTGESATAL